MNIDDEILALAEGEMREFFKERLSRVTKERKISVLKTLRKYGSNHWWNSKDTAFIARWQLYEDISIVPIDIFQEGLEELLGKKVMSHELIARQRLRKEAEAAVEQFDNGVLPRRKNQKEVDKIIKKAIAELRRMKRKRGVIPFEIEKNWGEIERP